MQSLPFFDRFILCIKRADSPFTKVLKRTIQFIVLPTVFRLPRVFTGPLRVAYDLHYMVISAFRTVVTLLYRGPLFQSRCASFGRHVRMDGKMPFVEGHVQIHIGNNVALGGNISIFSGRMIDEPRLIIEDRAEIGWNSVIAVNREVIIEEDVRIPNCRISDSDGHPREVDRRAANVPADLKDILPVRICRGAWIGTGSYILKGVTIGEGAVIGANSVVISNVPPYALAMGNPAEVIIKGFGTPAAMKRKAGARPPSSLAAE